MSTKRSVPLAIGIAIALSLPAWGYTWNLFMHILGAILFMGNIMVTAAWVSAAKRTGSTQTLNFAARSINKTDVIFTTPGAVLLLVNGGLLGTEWFKTGAPWIVVSFVLFVLVAIIWLALLVPTQRKLVAATDGGRNDEPTDAAVKLVGKWFRFGGIASVLALATLVLMVVKPKLWQ